MQTIRRRARAFTLIELLVVIVILGILMAVAVPTFLAQQQKAQDSKAQQQLATAYKAARTVVPETDGSHYPALASLVSDVQQSEPELVVSSGNCTQSTDDKHIVVDSVISGPSKLYLYGQSASGAVWRLDADPVNAPIFSRLGSCSGPLAASSLTAAGNEITDQTRAAAAQGDGRSSDSSYGMWSASTNLVKNGGFESGAGNLGWHGTTLAGTQDTAHRLFGVDSIKLVCNGTGACGLYPIYSSGGNPGTRVPVSASTVYSASVWVWVDQTTVFAPGIEWYDASNVRISTSTPPVETAPANQWTRLTVSASSPAGTVGATPVFYTQSTTTTQSLWFDGLQFEQQQFPTPYIETNGATASRAAARVQISASSLNTTQGWVAFRVRMGHNQAAGSSPTPLYPCFFWWGDNAGDQFRLDYHSVLGTWDMIRWNGSNIGEANISASYSAGDEETLIGTWTATQVGLSVNGSSFSYQANTAIPAMGVMPATVDIGQYGGAAYLNQRVVNSDILWQAMGTGTLTNTDAATINSWGDHDPTPQNFSAAAQAKETWSADSSTIVTG